MKFTTTTISCLAGIATALPQGSIEKDAEWTVSGLTVAAQPGEPGALGTHYSFTVKTSTQSALCDAHSHQGGAPLGVIPKTACNPDAFAFSWTPEGEGATLEIFDSTTKQHAVHQISGDEIRTLPFIVLGSHPHVYSGPTEFIVETQLD
ncbi:hypothetical protein SCUP234_11442 [Seiridium cupressi]